jgi:hypothetical protein
MDKTADERIKIIESKKKSNSMTVAFVAAFLTHILHALQQGF